MTSGERDTLERLLYRLRYTLERHTKELEEIERVGERDPVPHHSYVHRDKQEIAALDAALRELDVLWQLPKLFRDAYGTPAFGPSWRRLCELLPGLEGDGPPR